MALIIDDGTFLVGNSFIELEEADAFHLDRVNTEWIDADPDVKEAALIRMFDFLSVQPWKSTAFSDEIPLKVRQAQCVGAAKELTESGAMQPDLSQGIKAETLEDVVSVEYFEGGAGNGTLFTAIENLIAPYLISDTIISGTGRMRLVLGGGALEETS